MALTLATATGATMPLTDATMPSVIENMAIFNIVHAELKKKNPRRLILIKSSINPSNNNDNKVNDQSQNQKDDCSYNRAWWHSHIHWNYTTCTHNEATKNVEARDEMQIKPLTDELVDGKIAKHRRGLVVEWVGRYIARTCRENGQFRAFDSFKALANAF